MDLEPSTIVAISSPPGVAPRGIVRLSGRDAFWIAQRVAVLPKIEAGVFETVLRDPALAVTVLLFAGPRSFTGEDVAELHVVGNPVLLQMVLEQARRAGARAAEPGEFTARAFFNQKMDLTQAEGIAATIHADSAAALRAAGTLRGGDLHRRIAGMADEIVALLAAIEAGIDFADEADVRFIDPAAARDRLAALVEQVSALRRCAVRMDRIDALPTVVLAGVPNVGKSALINALTGQERAIISPVAGTTRDRLTATLTTAEGAVQLIDLPGEEEAGDELRAAMMATRRGAIGDADVVVEVIGPGDGLEEHVAAVGQSAREAPTIVVQNKCDLLEAQRRVAARWEDGVACGQVSALTGEGIAELRSVIVRRALAANQAGEQRVALNLRHRVILQSVAAHLSAAAGQAQNLNALQTMPELLAADLRAALDQLGQITGLVSPDDILGQVFARFCIGK